MCWLTVFTLINYLLNPGLGICVRWLTPVLGPELRVAAVAFQALFSSPFKHLEILAIWAIAGLAAGLIIGKKLGAALTAAVALFFILLILVSSGLNILFALNERPLFAERLPPLPPDSSIDRMIKIPLTEDLLEVITDLQYMAVEEAAVARLGPEQAYQTRLLTVALTPLLSNLVVALASAVAGSIIRSFVGRGRREAALLVILLALSMLPVSQAQQPPFTQPQYVEALIGAAMNDSTAIIASIFMKPLEKLGGLQPDSLALKSLVGAAILVVDTSPWSLPPSITRLVFRERRRHSLPYGAYASGSAVYRVREDGG